MTRIVSEEVQMDLTLLARTALEAIRRAYEDDDSDRGDRDDHDPDRRSGS